MREREADEHWNIQRLRHSHLRDSNLPNINSQVPVIDFHKFAGPTMGTTTKSVVTTADYGGQYGIHVNGGQNVVAFVADHTYLTSASVSFPDPGTNTDGTNRVDSLYAPTSKGPDTNCFEILSNYYQYHGQASTAALLRVYDFCKPINGNPGSFVYSLPLDTLDPRFITTETDADGFMQPRYRVASVLEGDNKWHALIYDWGLNVYEELDATTADAGTPTRSDGWSLFETHYAPSPCGSSATMRSASYAVQLPNTTTLAYVDYRSAGAANQPAPPRNQCFVNDNSGSGAYYVTSYDTTSGTFWNVDSY